MLQMLTVWCLDMTLQFDDKLYFVLLFSFLRDSFDMDVLMTGDFVILPQPPKSWDCRHYVPMSDWA